MSKVILYVTFFNIAILLLLNKQTFYFCFKISLTMHKSLICSINKNTQFANLLQNIVLIIEDEILMQHKYCFKTMHCTLQNLLFTKDYIFNNIFVILSKNFAQILFVIRKYNQAAVVFVYLQRSFL